MVGTGLDRVYPKKHQALAQRIVPELESPAEPKLAHDSSTNALIRRYRRLKAGKA